MSLIEGEPISIEFTSNQRVFAIVTEVGESIPNGYDVDWCDPHLHYHAHEASVDTRLTHRISENGSKAPTYYWAGPQQEVCYHDGADPAYCIRLDAKQLVPLFLPDEDLQQKFYDLHGIPALSSMNDALVPALVTYWEEMGLVEEGEVVYCSICKKHYDYEELAPCEHVHWCDACGCFSQPGGECSHRSADDTHYVDPEESEK